jgi:hypothetical protein
MSASPPSVHVQLPLLSPLCVSLPVPVLLLLPCGSPFLAVSRRWQRQDDKRGKDTKSRREGQGDNKTGESIQGTHLFLARPGPL